MATNIKTFVQSTTPVHGNEGVDNFAVPAEGFDEDIFGCLPGEVADVAANRLVVC